MLRRHYIDKMSLDNWFIKFLTFLMYVTYWIFSDKLLQGNCWLGCSGKFEISKAISESSMLCQMVFQSFEIIIRFPGARTAHQKSELNPIPSATLCVLLTFRNLMQFEITNTPFHTQLYTTHFRVDNTKWMMWNI